MNNTLDEMFLEAMELEKKKTTGNQFSGPLKKGSIVAFNETDVFLDLGSKSEAVVPIEEFDEPPVIGQEVFVILKEMKDGIHSASKRAAKKFEKLEEIQVAHRDDLPINGKIMSVIEKDGIPRGFLVDLGYDIDAFLPYSHMDTRKIRTPNELIGKSYDFAVIELKRNGRVISRKIFLRKTIKKLYNIFFEKHNVDDILKGFVDEVEQNFLILNIEGIKAFLHISDFSWKYLSDLQKIVKIEDELEVQIIQLDKSKDSVKVGKKQLMPDPWDDMEERFSLGDLVKAKVVRFKKEGAIVEVDDGLEAFLHVSEMSWTARVRDPKKFLKRGMIVDVKIKSIEPQYRRLDVSLRDVEENPWEKAGDKYSIGRKLEGKVSSILDFGVFVKFEDGIEGLLRKEDVDWLVSNVELKDKFQKGQDIKVVVLALDANREKLRLGIKQLSDNPYRTFLLNYPKGSPVECTVKKILENGVIVELENKIDGFIHISNLDKGNVEKPGDAVSEGEKIKCLMKFVDVAKKKIELSRKDFLFFEEKKEVQKYIVTENIGSQSTSFGMLLKDQLKGLKLESDESNTDKLESKEKKTTKPAKKKPVVKKETTEIEDDKEDLKTEEKENKTDAKKKIKRKVKKTKIIKKPEIEENSITNDDDKKNEIETGSNETIENVEKPDGKE